MVRHDGSWITDWTVHLPDSFWWLAGVLLTFDVVYSLVRLVKNHWSTALRLTTVINNLVWLAMLSYVLMQPRLLSLSNQASAEIEGLLPIMNTAVRGVLIFICAILVWEIATHTWRLVKK
jgi:hypothetical protein